MNQIKEPNYIIQATWQNGKTVLLGYVQIDWANIKLVSKKEEATSFSSRMLANGWLMKTQIIYPTYKISMITL